REVAEVQGPQSKVARGAGQAKEATRRAADQVQAGALPEAQESGKESAERLRRLAQDLSQTPRGRGEEGRPDPLDQSRGLARRQEEVNRKLAALADDPGAGRAQQQARQEDLRRQAGELQQGLERAARQMGDAPQAGQPARQAADSAGQAQEAM